MPPPDPAVLAWLEDRDQPPWRGYAEPVADCRWCPHGFHGLPCTSCTCDSSVGACDDSWRPAPAHTPMGRMAEVAHATGCDGWVARLAVSAAHAPGRAPHRIKLYLEGTLTDSLDRQAA